MNVYNIKGFSISLMKNEDYQHGILLGNIDANQKQNSKIQTQNATDPRLGSAVFNDSLCPTCNLNGKNCKGHFGYIKLNSPIFNTILLGFLQKVMVVFCISCSNFTLGPIELKRIQSLYKQQEQQFKYIMTKCKNQPTCYYCKRIQPKITIEFLQGNPTVKLQIAEKDTQIYYIKNVQHFLNNIPLIQFQQIFQVDFQPIDLIFSKYFPIPPPHVRTQLGQTIFNQGKTFQNQLTQLYQQLIKNLVQTEYSNQIYDIMNEIFGVLNDVKKTINKNSFKEKIDKKGGIFRQNVLQKRVDNSFRSVIGGSVDIDIDEIIIPIKILQNLSIPTLVTEQNIQILQQIVNNGRVYPGANFIIKEDGQKYRVKGKLKDTDTENKNEQLKVGYTVFRHPLRGERCILNRQPTIHLYSMNYVKIVPGTSSVIKLNNAITDMYNADFDGDEASGLFLVNQANIEGAKLLNTLDQRCTNLNDNSIVIVPNHDTPFGIYIFTKYLYNQQISREHMLFLMQKTNFENVLEYKKNYTGKEIWEYILTEQLQKYFNIIPCSKKTQQQLYLDYFYINGPMKTKIFMQNVQVFTFQVIIFIAKTLTIDDTISTLDYDQMQEDYIEIENNIQEQLIKDIFIEQKKINIFKETNEQIIYKTYMFNKVREDKILEYFKDDNGYMNMIKSGSKGKKNHIMSIQHQGIMMQGSDLFPRGDNNRYCPYFSVNVGLREANCIFNGLHDGFNTQSDFIAAIQFARLGFVIQKFKTAVPGYINRKLDQFLSSVSVSYFNTLLINNQMLLSLCFAGNNIDIKYQRNMTSKLILYNNEKITDEFEGCSVPFIQEIFSIRDQIRKTYLCSRFYQKIQTNFRNPIDFNFLMNEHKKEQEQQKEKEQNISSELYEKGFYFFINNLNIISNNQQGILYEADQQQSKIMQLFFLEQISFKILSVNKISNQTYLNIVNDAIYLYNRYKINPGEYIGLQCCQAFSKDITQKAIDAFHKTGAEKVEFPIDWVDQLQKYLQVGTKVASILTIRFKKQYRKNKELIDEISRYLTKKSLKLYVQSYSFGDDKFFNSEYFGMFSGYLTDDIIQITQKTTSQPIEYLSQLPKQKQIFLQQYRFYIDFQLDKYQMEKDNISINLIQYSLANYLNLNNKNKLVDTWFDGDSIFIFYNQEDYKIQIRAKMNKKIDISSNLTYLLGNFINNINLNYRFQDYQIDNIRVYQKEIQIPDQKGNIINDFEYIIQIYDNIKDFFFLRNCKYVSYNRCTYNDLRVIQEQISIIHQQRILNQIIFEAGVQIIGSDEQLPQNVQLIAQVMAHQKELIPIFRSGLKFVQGQDALYQASFETQFNCLIDGAIQSSTGTNLNNYTDYIMNSKCMIGPMKSQLLTIGSQPNYGNKTLKININQFSQDYKRQVPHMIYINKNII